MSEQLQAAAGAAEPLPPMTSAKVAELFGLDLDSVQRLRKKRAVTTVEQPNEAGKPCPHYDPSQIAAIVPCLQNRRKLKRYGHLKTVDASDTPDDDPSTISGPIKLLRHTPDGELPYTITDVPPEKGIVYTLAGASRATGIPKTALKSGIGTDFEDFRIYGAHRLFFGSELTKYLEDNNPTQKIDAGYRDYKGLCALVKATKPHQRAEVAEQKALWEERGVLPFKSVLLEHTRNAIGNWERGTDGKRVTTKKKTVKRAVAVTVSHAVIFKQLWEQDPTHYIEEIKKLAAGNGITSADLKAKMLAMDIGGRRLKRYRKIAGVGFTRRKVGERGRFKVGERGRFVVKHDGPCPQMSIRAPGETAAWLKKRLEEGLHLWQTIVERAEKEGISEQALRLASDKLECQRRPIGGKPIGGGRWNVIALPGHTLPTFEEGKRLIAEYRRAKAATKASQSDEASPDGQAPPVKRRKSGRDMDESNEALYSLCHQVREAVKAKTMKTVQAVAKVLGQFGRHALGSTKEGAPAPYRDQKSRLKHNAEVYRKHIEN